MVVGRILDIALACTPGRSSGRPRVMAEQREARDRQDALLAAFRERGERYECRQISHGDVFPGQPVVWENDRCISVLICFRVRPATTLLIFKPNREDIGTLTDDEASDLMSQVMRPTRALKTALGAEKVYVPTMCDRVPNHLHVQLLPR